MGTTIGIVADFDATSKSHAATQAAIAHSAKALNSRVDAVWIGTDELATTAGMRRLAECGGYWIGPGSPYRNMDGALSAIRIARESGIPLLGTCGGFQHIVLEYARNVLGFADAEHEESAPGASRHFISRLACSLVGRTMTISVNPASKLASLYGATEVQEEYLCNFGVNPRFLDKLTSGRLKVCASDAEGAMRAVELPEHPFFFGTLFLPQHRSLGTVPHPLVSAFVAMCARPVKKAKLHDSMLWIGVMAGANTTFGIRSGSDNLPD